MALLADSCLVVKPLVWNPPPPRKPLRCGVSIVIAILVPLVRQCVDLWWILVALQSFSLRLAQVSRCKCCNALEAALAWNTHCLSSKWSKCTRLPLLHLHKADA